MSQYSTRRSLLSTSTFLEWKKNRRVRLYHEIVNKSGIKCWIKNKCRKYGVKNGNMNHLQRSDSTRTCKSFPLSKFHSLSITIWTCTISSIFCPLRLIIQKQKTFMLKNSNDWHLPCSISKHHLFSFVLIIVSKRSQRKH